MERQRAFNSFGRVHCGTKRFCITVLGLICLLAVILLIVLCDWNQAVTDLVVLLRTKPKNFEKTSSQKSNDIQPGDIDSDQGDVLLISAWTKYRKWDSSDRWLWGSFDECTNLEPWMKCDFSTDRGEVARSDAVLFRCRETQPEDLPERTPDQKWIFVETEAPPNAWKRPNPNWALWKQFNLTSTFTEDSDIPYGIYQKVCKYDHKKACLGCHDYAKPKKMRGRAAWVVSHCKCHSHRENYVEELQKHFPVDIFGGCGKSLPGDKKHYYNSKKFLTHFLHDYKFYLSMENSLCDNYYTEKMTNYLKTDVIQIFMGTVDYSQFLPAGSFLNVKDFASPKDLAERMKYLDGNDTAFNEYIARKFTSTCEDDMKISKLSYGCRLCEYLHRHRGEVQTVPDVSRFWGVQERCLDTQDFFSTHAPGRFQPRNPS